MGNDLYWYATPKPVEPTEYGCDNIRYILMELFAIKEVDEMVSMELTEQHLPFINAAIVGLKQGASEDVLESMVRLADGVRKHKSITFTYHG